MNKTKHKSGTVLPVFVETIPTDSVDIQAGKLYISMKYNTLVHRCPCGCEGLSEIGLHSATRRMIYDGENVSIEPSIGVRTLHCRSHYWITKNRIVWEKPLSEALDECYDRDRIDLTKAYGENQLGQQAAHEKGTWCSRLLRKALKILLPRKLCR